MAVMLDSKTTIPDMTIVTNTVAGNIYRIGYDTHDHILFVQFYDSSRNHRPGRMYRYFHVPRWVFNTLLTSPSIGTEFHKLVKQGEYRYERIDNTKDDATLVSFRVIFEDAVVGSVGLNGVTLYSDNAEVVLHNQGTLPFGENREGSVLYPPSPEVWRLDIVMYYVDTDGELIQPVGIGDSAPMPSSLLERFVVVRSRDVLSRLPHYHPIAIRVTEPVRVRL